MKKVIYILVVMLMISAAAHAQNGFRYDTIRPAKTVAPEATQAKAQTAAAPKAATAKNGFRKENIEIGGSLGLSFGSYGDAVNISPQVGYRFNRYFSAGVGLGYSYYSYKDSFGKDTYNYMGLNLYTKVNPIRYITLQVQPEFFSMWGRNVDSRFVPVLLVGGGVTLPVGRTGGINMMLYYDVVQDDYSPYSREIFYGIGYTFGF